MAIYSNYSSTQRYSAGDIVNVSGTLWRAVIANTGVIPGTEYRVWTLFTGEVNNTQTPVLREPPDVTYPGVCVEEVEISGYVWTVEEQGAKPMKMSGWQPPMPGSGIIRVPTCSGGAVYGQDGVPYWPNPVEQTDEHYATLNYGLVAWILEVNRKSTCYDVGDPRTIFEPFEEEYVTTPNLVPSFPNGDGQSFGHINLDSANCLTRKYTFRSKSKSSCECVPEEGQRPKYCKQYLKINWAERLGLGSHYSPPYEGDLEFLCCEITKEQFYRYWRGVYEDEAGWGWAHIPALYASDAERAFCEFCSEQHAEQIKYLIRHTHNKPAPQTYVTNNHEIDFHIFDPIPCCACPPSQGGPQPPTGSGDGNGQIVTY